MNIERFIALRLIRDKSFSGGYARPVMVVSVISTALGIAVMLLSVFIASGFQNQIRTKVIGFGSHIQVLPYYEDAETGSEAMQINQDFYAVCKANKAIQSIHPVAYKPGILQRTRKNNLGNREIQGVLFKGINNDFDTTFLAKNLREGRLLQFGKNASKEILISAKIAQNLSVKLGDTLAAVLISKKADYSVAPDFRKFIVCGIYETELEDFDNEYVFIDMQHIQKANGWGMTIVPNVHDTLEGESIKIDLNCIAATKVNWQVNDKPYPFSQLLLPSKSATYTIVAIDDKAELLNDTVVIRVNAPAETTTNHDGYVKEIENRATVQVRNLEGSAGFYASGFEVNLKNWDALIATKKWIEKQIGPSFSAKTIVDQQPQIFNWLELVDLNVKIIVGLMLIVAIINLVSAVLVLILERSKMIGLLKSFGAQNATVGKVFFYFTFHILIKGLLIGNAIALALYAIQTYTGFLHLNPETYFVSQVPMQFNWFGFIFVNVLTLAACMLAFFLPVMLVTRINPVKAIKIE